MEVVGVEKSGENVMTIHQDWEPLLSAMSRAEKALLLQWIVRDLGDSFPGIDTNQLVCGGEPCIVRTRIPVWVLVRARNLGMSEADILRSYPTLCAEDLANTWGYYRTHRSVIDNEIKENEAA
ncbi:MAG: DUF433 domain-containing protein [Pseudomonadota bacterium]